MTTPDEGTHHWWPQFLPDGRRFIFEIYAAQTETKGVYVASLDAPDEWRRLLPVPMRGRYGSGHLLYVQEPMDSVYMGVVPYGPVFVGMDQVEKPPNTEPSGVTQM